MPFRPIESPPILKFHPDANGPNAMISAELLRQSRVETVAQSLREDIGDGDITAQLIAADTQAQAGLSLVNVLPWRAKTGWMKYSAR